MVIFLVLLLLKLQSLQLTVSSSTSQGGPPIAKPGCPDRCGGVWIPYPFGIGSRCYHNKSYEIICNTSFHPPKPFLPVHDFHFEVMDIFWDDNRFAHQTLQVKSVFHNICSSDNGVVTDSPVVKRVDIRGSPFRFSRENVFEVKGCGASFILKNSSNEIVTGCSSICSNNISKKGMTNRNGVGYCHSSLLEAGLEDHGLDFYEIDFNYEALFNIPTCNVSAGLVANVDVRQRNFLSSITVLEWNGADTAAEDMISDISVRLYG